MAWRNREFAPPFLWKQGGLETAHLGATIASLSPSNKVMLGHPPVKQAGHNLSLPGKLGEEMVIETMR